jgi:hypothetical protein
MSDTTTEPTEPRIVQFDNTPVRWQFRDIVNAATREHAAWVDGGGLQTGLDGPLDDLIREFSECVDVARRAKTLNEEA